MRRATVFHYVFVLLGVMSFVPFAQAQPTVQLELVAFTNIWKYNQTVSWDGTNWTSTAFDDAALPSGRGVLALESANDFVTSRTNTILTLGRLTYYFRTHFNFTGNVAGATLTFSNIVDDGAVYYLNGVEINRLYLPAAPAVMSYSTLATSHEATAFDVFKLSGPVLETNLVNGDNVLAVEVHQTASTSSDIVFGTSVSATVVDTNPPPTLRMPAEPPTFGYTLVNAFGNLTFSNPTVILSPPGETNRLFVVEQGGKVAVIPNLAAPNRSVFLDISAKIVGGSPTDERGLLGMTFHPGYATNGYFYLFYSCNSTTPGIATNALHERVARFQVSATNANVAATNEQILIDQYDQAGNHNGGCLQFGPDGYLYISVGDEGDQNSTLGNSQRLDRDFFSAILRIDVDKRAGNLAPNPHPSNTNNPSGTINYSIPSDNPYLGVTSFNGTNISPSALRTEFYAIGFRNPWRFSFDPTTGYLYCGDVGQDTWEEIDIVVKGANYGWYNREGLHQGPGPATIPVGNVDPIQEYHHGTAANQGNSVSGGVVYRGSNIPSLYGHYVFADYVSGNVWALRYDQTNTVPFFRLTGDAGIAAFGVDPRNGDVLTADQSEDTIKRLVYDTNTVIGTQLPPTLAQTGAFTNLETLTAQSDLLPPNAGMVPYDINVPFWSDNARKSRWFFDAGLSNIVFRPEGPWTFPAGMAWVKHFDLELTNGVPESSRRLETRILVKTTNSVYGVTYRWGNSLTNATLVPDAGLDEEFTINDAGVLRTQVWHYPSRSECLSCHTSAGGWALGFNTLQLNKKVDFGTGLTNQIARWNRAGYFAGSLSNLHALRALAHAANTNASAEWRVRSYLAANCAQCHQPGGLVGSGWTAAITNRTADAGIVRGALNNNGGDPDNRVVTPGDVGHSMMLARISTRGAGQMPPLATTVLDTNAMALLRFWITNDLPSFETFAQWQVRWFGSTDEPNAAADFDADGDFSANYAEYVAGTNPLDPVDAWGVSISGDAGHALLQIPQPANRLVEVQEANSLGAPSVWTFLDLPENRPCYPSAARQVNISQSLTNGLQKFYRVRLSQP
jgi:glucose/arabinose dehydrogenase